MQKFDENLYREKYRIKSNRILGYNYSALGYYFITICTNNMVEHFGKIVNAQMALNKYGKIVQQNLYNISNHCNNVLIDEFVVMPNHIHAIFEIITDLNGDRIRRDVACNVSTVERKNYYAKISPKRGSLSVVVRSFKSAYTKQIHDIGLHDFAWQSNYYEHIVRGEKSLNRIREYIINNPRNWIQDRNNIK
jgi:REP-associated tyrosine transposase